MSQKETIPQQTINNAISAYLLLFVSATFLFQKKEKHTNNSFVKAHTKIALILHSSLLVSYIIFISFSFLSGIHIFGYSLNYIVSSTIFLFLLLLLLLGIYKASQGKYFVIGEILQKEQRKKMLHSDEDNNLNEKNKLTLILSHIPFVGYIINGKYKSNATIRRIVFLNLLITLIISFIYISNYDNLAVFLLFFYISFFVFSSINIISFNTVIHLKIDFIPSPERLLFLIKSYSKYLKNYFSQKTFIGIEKTQQQYKQKRKENELFNTKILQKKSEINIPPFIIYIPFLNIITFGFLKSKYIFHIINGLILTLLFTLTLILNYFHLLSVKYHLLFLFPIFFGIGYIHSRLAYKMPFIYDIFELFIKIRETFKKSKKIIKEKQAETHEETLQVKKEKRN